MTLDTAMWDWRYRYSPFGTREQKRLYYSPHGDSCGYLHPWVYYLQGAGGEQLAVYHGVQTADLSPTDSFRRVLMYPSQYLTNGGELSYNLNAMNGTTKDFQITDNLGNVRAVLIFNISDSTMTMNSYDYKPFGDTLWTSAGSENRLGFIGRERDYENNYFAFGARNYDSETGRFLSVDPLFEAFPNQTPYHYAYNSPIQFKDPSGLAPEDEKKERVQAFEVDWETLANSHSMMNRTRYLMSIGVSDLIRWLNSGLSILIPPELFANAEAYSARFFETLSIEASLYRGGNSGSPRTGDDIATENGLPINIKINFTGTPEEGAEKKEKLFSVVNSSDELLAQWNTMVGYYRRNPDYTLTITDWNKDYSGVFPDNNDTRHSTLFLGFSFFDCASEIDKSGYFVNAIRNLSHELAHIIGKFSGERIAQGQFFTLSNGIKISAEELRAQQIANDVVNKWLIREGKSDKIPVNWDGWSYMGLEIPYNQRFPGSVDFSRFRKKIYRYTK